MLLIVGLGNIGDKYKLNRHNVGFMFVDSVASLCDFSRFTNKFKGLIAEKQIASEKILLLKPQTFMNLSGKSVLEVMNFYKITPEDIIVIQDDVDLEFSDIRYKTNSGDGGQKGIRSIQETIGKSIHRVKIGVGRPQDNNHDISSYVLSDFNQEEMAQLSKLFTKCADSLSSLIQKDFKKFIEDIKKT